MTAADALRRLLADVRAARDCSDADECDHALHSCHRNIRGLQYLERLALAGLAGEAAPKMTARERVHRAMRDSKDGVFGICWNSTERQLSECSLVCDALTKEFEPTEDGKQTIGPDRPSAYEHKPGSKAEDGQP